MFALFLYSFFVLGVSNLIFMIYQPYFRATNVSLPMFDLIFAAFSVFAAFAAWNAHDFERRLGIIGSLLIMPLFIGLPSSVRASSSSGSDSSSYASWSGGSSFPSSATVLIN